LLPLELDFELALVGLELKLEFEPDLTRDMDCELDAVALKLEVVDAGQHVGEVLEPSCGFRSPQLFVLFDLENVR
jgi:hypothetical protein